MADEQNPSNALPNGWIAVIEEGDTVKVMQPTSQLYVNLYILFNALLQNIFCGSLFSNLLFLLLVSLLVECYASYCS